MDLEYLSEIAIQAAYSAGKIIRQHMDNDVIVEKKPGQSSYAAQVVTMADKASEQSILSHLLPTCKDYNIALLSEETEDDGSRFKNDFFWCVDPMDGTLPFINGYPGFSVSIALVAQDGTPHIGVVYDPSTDTFYHAIKGKGVYKNNQAWIINHKNNFLTYVTDRKLIDTPHATDIEQWLHEKAKELGLARVKELAGAGSVLNGIRVLENSPACMVKLPKKESGGGSVWDYAAIACMFQEFGLPSRTYKGGRLDLNRRGGTFMNNHGIFFSSIKNLKV